MPTVAQSNYATFAATLSPTVTIDSGATAGQLLVAFVGNSGPANPGLTPAGWENVLGGWAAANSTTASLHCLVHLITAAEQSGSTVSWTLTNLYGNSNAGWCTAVVLDDVNTFHPIDAANFTISSTAVTPHVIAGLDGDALLDDSLVISCVAADGAITYSAAPTGWTIIDNTSATPGQITMSKDAATTAGTDIAATTVTPSGSDEHESITVAFTDGGQGPTSSCALVQSATGAISGTTITLTLGSTPTVGNLLVVNLQYRSTASTTSISGSGWTRVDHAYTASARWQTMWWKEAGASEPTGITISFSPSTTATAVVSEYSGLTDPILAAFTPGYANNNGVDRTQFNLPAVAIGPGIAVHSLGAPANTTAATVWVTNWFNEVAEATVSTTGSQHVAWRELSAEETDVTAVHLSNAAIYDICYVFVSDGDYCPHPYLAYVGEFTANASGTTIAPVIPAGAAADDLMVLALMCNGSTTFTTPTDWTVLGTGIESDANQSTKFFYKIHDGSESDPSSTTSLTLDATNGGYGRVLVYRGVDTSAPVEDVTMTGAPTASQTPPSALIDTTGDHRFVVALLLIDNDSGYNSNSNPPPLWARHGAYVTSTTGGDAMFDAMAKLVRYPAPVAAATFGSLFSAADYWRALTMALVAPATVAQEGFRWRNDDGSETSATWIEAQDTNTSLDLPEEAVTYLDEVLADSPAGLWMLDETAGTNANDSTANNRDGTYTSTFTLNGGTIFGLPAVDLSGGGRIEVADNTAFSGHAGASGLFTMECLLNLDTLTTGEYVTKAGGGGVYEFRFYSSGGIPGFTLWTSAGVDVVAFTSLHVIFSTGVDYHVVVTIDRAAQECRLYVDGTDRPLSPTTPTFSGNSSDTASIVSIGRRADGSNAMDGRIAGVALYPTVLSGARVADHYAALTTPPPASTARLRVLLDATGDPEPSAYTLYYRKAVPSFIPTDLSDLLGWWMGDGAGNSVSQWNDESGAGRHFTQATGGYQPTRTVTLNGLAVYSFSGTDQGMGPLTVTNLITDNTVSMAIVARNTAGGTFPERRLLSGRPSGGADWSGDGFVNGMTGSASLRWPGIRRASVEAGHTAGDSSYLNVWLMYVTQYDGSTVSMWIDGSPAATTGVATSSNFDIDELNIGMESGTSPPGSEWLGDIAEIVLWGSADSTDRTNVEEYLTAKWFTDSWLPVPVGTGGGDPVYIATSTNITASGQATTAQLTAPSGKSSADFSVGRMWDDENGTDSVDIESTPWTPLNIAGMQAWFDASDAGSITASAGAVSQWNDKSGNARHVVQATGANQPTTGATTLNGLNVLTFDGTNDALSTSGSVQIVNSSTGVWSGFAVVRPTGTLSGNIRAYMGQATGTQIWQMRHNNGAVNVIVYDTSGSNYQDSQGTHTAGVATLVSAVRGPTTVEIWKDSVSTGATTTSGTIQTASYNLWVGHNSSSAYWTGDIAELIVYNAQVVGDDRAMVEWYLRLKWGTL